MLTIHETAKYRRDVRRVIRRGKNRALLDAVVNTLREEKPLDPKHRDHALHGSLEGFRDCHIENDWVLVYAVNNKELILTLSQTGAHADIFG
jgi:mRNA interferase YafQ